MTAGNNMVGNHKNTGTTGNCRSTVGSCMSTVIDSCRGNRVLERWRARSEPSSLSGRQQAQLLLQRHRQPVRGPLRRWNRWWRRLCIWLFSVGRPSPMSGNNRKRRHRFLSHVGPFGHQITDRLRRNWTHIPQAATVLRRTHVPNNRKLRTAERLSIYNRINTRSKHLPKRVIDGFCIINQYY